MNKKSFVLIFATLVSPLAARADIKAMEARVPQIVELKTKGLVGEQPDGLLAAVKDDPAVKAVVDAENKDRLEEYTKRAAEQGQPLEIFMKVLGEAKVRQEKEGRFVRSPEGEWIKKK